MDPFENAVADLIAAASADKDSVDEAYAAAQRLLAELEIADPAACQRALGSLADALPSAPLDCTGVIALACGALVENGGNPERPLDALLDRLPEALAGAEVFAAACRERARNTPTDDENAGDAVERFGDEIAEKLPAEMIAWGTLDLFGMALIAALSRSPEARRRAHTRKSLIGQLAAVIDVNQRAKFLLEMLRVLDEQEFLVLHPELRRGWMVRLQGVSDNFQLHTLLADAVIGDPEKGLLPGRQPDPRVAAASRDQPVDPAAPLAEGAFDLFNWQGLQPDKTLPMGKDAMSHWIWNEGAPADVEPFDGVRVVLLGPPSCHRTWDAGRRFEDLTADLRVTQTLTPAAVEDWLTRIAAAPQRNYFARAAAPPSVKEPDE